MFWFNNIWIIIKCQKKYLLLCIIIWILREYNHLIFMKFLNSCFISSQTNVNSGSSLMDSFSLFRVKELKKLVLNPFVGFIKRTHLFWLQLLTSKVKENHILFCSPLSFYFIIFSLDCLVKYNHSVCRFGGGSQTKQFLSPCLPSLYHVFSLECSSFVPLFSKVYSVTGDSTH